jgi:aspartate/methionine/tyrosine aminotransferase
LASSFSPPEFPYIYTGAANRAPQQHLNDKPDRYSSGRMTRLHRHSDYMQWAKLHSKARFNLATSDVGAYPLRELNVTIDQLEINGDNSYGFAPLQYAIAQKHDVDPACVVETAGTSMANHLAMAALIDPGEEVLIESPTYELIVSAAQYLQAKIVRFPRHEENGFAVDPQEIRKAITPKTKLIFLTNLHNPSSVLTPDNILGQVGDIAAAVRAHVIVDEVYLDAVYDNTPRSSFHLGKNFVVTSSLTKVYGLSGLRCGWILAQPDLARAMYELNDLFAATPAHPTELLSVIAFQNLNKIRDRARTVVEADRADLKTFLDASTNYLSAVRSAYGTTCFPKLLHGDVTELLQRLRLKFETTVVPGQFFEMPDHFRIGMGVDHEMFSEGLRRLSGALNPLS